MGFYIEKKPKVNNFYSSDWGNVAMQNKKIPKVMVKKVKKKIKI